MGFCTLSEDLLKEEGRVRTCSMHRPVFLILKVMIRHLGPIGSTFFQLLLAAKAREEHVMSNFNVAMGSKRESWGTAGFWNFLGMFFFYQYFFPGVPGIFGPQQCYVNLTPCDFRIFAFVVCLQSQRPAMEAVSSSIPMQPESAALGGFLLLLGGRAL